MVDSFKIEGDNSQPVKEDYLEESAPKIKKVTPVKKKGGNALTKYFDKLYLNEPTQDTSKISGKDLINQNTPDLAYLKSVTDGANAKGP